MYIMLLVTSSMTSLVTITAVIVGIYSCIQNYKTAESVANDQIMEIVAIDELFESATGCEPQPAEIPFIRI